MVQSQSGIHSFISANWPVAPISLGGYLMLGNGVRKVGVKQIQLEQVCFLVFPPHYSRVPHVYLFI